MKQYKAKTNIVATLVLLVLAVLCVTNVTYSYFSSTSAAQGEIVFGDLDVDFVYKGPSDTFYQTKDSATLNLYSASGAIAVGTSFNLSLTNGGAAIQTLGIQNSNTSCPCYIRFWFDAYVVKNGVVDKTKNYGKYFLLPTGNAYYTNANSSVASSWCYYITVPMNANNTLDLGNTLTLSNLTNDIVPIDVIGEILQISISFEAVQVANKAYLSVFGSSDDTRGYYKSWT